MKFIRLFRLTNIDMYIVVPVSLALLIITNLLIGLSSFRLDFSKGSAYTLSPSTKKILHSLDDVVNIKFFVSSDLPTPLLPVKAEVTDLLNEYKKEGRGKISIKIMDPKKDPGSLEEVRELGIPELQYSQLEKNKYQLSNAYFALGIFYADKKEVLPQATDLGNLEYNTISLLYKLTRKESIKIAIVGMEQAATPQQDPYVVFRNILSQQYEIIPLDLFSDLIKEIDSSYKTVVLIDSNKKKYGEKEREKLKKYVENKGKIIFLVDGVGISDNLSTQPASHDLFSLFESWGISLNKDFILSSSAEYVNFGNDIYQFMTPYPFWVKTNNFNKKTGYFSNVAQLTFPWTSSVSLNNKNGLEVQTLVSSSKSSWDQKDSYELLPQKIKQPEMKDIKVFPLVAQVQTRGGGTVVLIPSSRFLNVQYLSKNSGNVDFIFNLVNNLASGGALSGIRSRTVTFYPLPELPDSTKDAVKYLDTLLLPALLALYGGIRLMRRK